jgi:transposase
MTAITRAVDLPPGVTSTAYERVGDGHGFQVAGPLPTRCRCDRCRREEATALEFRDTVHVVRDWDLGGQPRFWVYRPALHRCPWCNHRQYLIPPFKRKNTRYTYRFEQQVLRMLSGSNEEEVARRLGISAETVGLIVRNRLADARAKQVEPQRVITDVGIDALSLKKRHPVYAPLLTDLPNPQRPQVLAGADGRDEAAARKCLEKLAEPQRRQGRTYRADLAQAFHHACRDLLPFAKPVVDRFPVAKQFNEAIDDQRKKNHPGVQGETVSGPAKGVSLPEGGVSPEPDGTVPRGYGEARGAVWQAPPAADAVRVPGAVPEDL